MNWEAYMEGWREAVEYLDSGDFCIREGVSMARGMVQDDGYEYDFERGWDDALLAALGV